MAQATHRKPACLPEQLLWIAPAVPPARASACAEGWWIGQCAPHSSAAASSPARASMRVAVATWPGSPECEAQASASSSGPRPKRSAAPLSTSGSACSAFIAERG